MIWLQFLSRSRRPDRDFQAAIPAAFSMLLFACASLLSADSLPRDLETSCEARVALVWMDPNQLFPWREKQVAGEAETVLADAGIDASWSAYNQPEDESPPSDGETAIKILLTPMDASVWGLEDNAMGAVVESGEKPMVFIFFPNLL